MDTTEQCFNSSGTSNSATESDSCCVCLEELSGESGTIDCCAHLYCAECIKSWGRLNNTCPLDRKIFEKIYVGRQPDGSCKETIIVEVIRYIPFVAAYITSELNGVPQEPRARYFQKCLDVLDSLQRLILHRLRSENYFTRYVDHLIDDIYYDLSEEMILMHLSAHKRTIMAKMQPRF